MTCGCPAGLDPGWHRVVCGLHVQSMPTFAESTTPVRRSRGPRLHLADVAALRAMPAHVGEWGRAENRALAAWLRERGYPTSGSLWDAAKRIRTAG